MDSYRCFVITMMWWLQFKTTDFRLEIEHFLADFSWPPLPLNRQSLLRNSKVFCRRSLRVAIFWPTRPFFFSKRIKKVILCVWLREDVNKIVVFICWCRWIDVGNCSLISNVNIHVNLVGKFLTLKNRRGEHWNSRDIGPTTHSVSSDWSILALIIII